jgi:hypothetical protein
MDMSIYHLLEKINSDAREVAFNKVKVKIFIICLVILGLGQIILTALFYIV